MVKERPLDIILLLQAEQIGCMRASLSVIHTRGSTSIVTDVLSENDRKLQYSRSQVYVVVQKLLRNDEND